MGYKHLLGNTYIVHEDEVLLVLNGAYLSPMEFHCQFQYLLCDCCIIQFVPNFLRYPVLTLFF